MKLPWPVAKIREDGAPAIWLTMTNWLVVRDGIVRHYLDEREYEGKRRARNEARKTFGPEWRTCPDLNRWACVDIYAPLCSDENAALELYRAGWEAHDRRHAGDRYMAKLSPEDLVAHGHKHEERGYREEVKRLKALSRSAEKSESVAAIVSDQPKTVSPDDRSVIPAAVAVNPGRALEAPGLGVAA